ncbi:hypothetical protein FGM00_10460 [Aggregatimonas sangjinii]|uniref:DUF1080 domain-containing protein n=1 Tax=Aggregatimonas sangjinii TaxID=2583587 RepID=A0A5B7SPC6_9FLAO|nr:hypothetical protein [Aggregatimonas sangjinii]QCX00515.1 hypothetical protein FGM00_10460 [Aggregatimonas sangjinii]
MMKKVFLGFTLLVMVNVIHGQRKDRKEKKAMEFPMTEKHWTSVSDNVEFMDYKSTNAVRSTDDKGLAIMLKDFEFTNGTIEFDVELKGMGFPGIDFRIDKDTLNSEKCYLRYFGAPNALSRNTLQYAAVLDRVNLWDLTDDYQAAATLYEGKWNHVKLVISGKQMKVYVNDTKRAALHVPALEGITESGGISLTGNVIYANFVVRPNETEDLASNEGYDPTYNDSRYLRKWEVTQPSDFPFGKDIFMGIENNPGVAINPAYLDSTGIWKPIKAGYRSLVNLTKEFGGSDIGPRKLAWIKTTISSETAQEKRVDMGFSDEVWVFVNGQPLYTDRNYYGSPGMKEPKGRCTIENTSFQLPLEKGDNEILIGVTNYFYGWGLIARVADTEGLRFN